MATFAPISYTYVPTAPRSKSTATRRKPAPEQVSIRDKLQHMRSSNASLSTPRPVAAAAAANDDGGDYGPGIRGTGTVYRRGDEVNDDENDDDCDLPTIEELLLAKLQEQGFATEDRGSDKTGGVEEVASEERRGSVDQRRSAQSDNLGGSPDDPIVLLGEDDSSASEAEVDDASLRAKRTEADAGLFDSAENAVGSTAPAPPSPDLWHDIDDLPEPAPRLQLAERGASTTDSIRPHAPPSRLSSEPLHGSIGVVHLYPNRAKSEATTSSARPRSPSLHCGRVSPENQPGQEGHLHTGRGVADEHRLVGPARGITLPVNEVEREQQEVEQEDEDNDEDGDERLQQEVNDVAAVVTAERVGGSPRPADRQQSLSNHDPPLAPSHNEGRSDSHNDDELNSTDSDDADEQKPRPAKRKWASSSHESPMRKKRKHRLRQRSTRQHRPRSKPHGCSPKSHSPLDQGSAVAAVSSTEDRLPSPASAPHATDTDMSPDCYNLDRSSGAALPTLSEVSFRPHSPHCCSFTAVIRDGCAERGVSFSQVVRLIASIGHVGKIDDFTIKPVEQHSFLLTGFSRHNLSQPSSSRASLSAAEAGRNHVNARHSGPRHGRAVGARARASRRNKPLISDDECELSDSDSESSSDDDGCPSEAEQGRLRTSKHSRWTALDEQRLLAWKREDKSWHWIFSRFPGRTPAAVRTRWTMAQRRAT